MGQAGFCIIFFSCVNFFFKCFHMCSFTVLDRIFKFRSLTLSALCFVSLPAPLGKTNKGLQFSCRPSPCCFHVKKDANRVEKLDCNRPSSAKRNFYDVAGLLMEQYMIKNVDVLERLKNCDTPTI